MTPPDGLKVSPYLKTEGQPIIRATTLLMSMLTGQPILLCDSMALTTERTAATTALAVDLLARRDACKLAVIGSGPVALAHLRYVLPLRDWTGIRISSMDLPRLAQALRPRLAALGQEVEIAENQDHALEDADVVMLL